MQVVYEPLLSVAQVSIASAAVTAVDLASASLPLLRWFRNEGMAIAARMPMIRITTRSSIRVKPFSLLGALAELPQHVELLLLGGCTAGLAPDPGNWGALTSGGLRRPQTRRPPPGRGAGAEPEPDARCIDASPGSLGPGTFLDAVSRDRAIATSGWFAAVCRLDRSPTARSAAPAQDEGCGGRPG